LDGLCQ